MTIIDVPESSAAGVVAGPALFRQETEEIDDATPHFRDIIQIRSVHFPGHVGRLSGRLR
jgi:hypothetical protein